MSDKHVPLVVPGDSVKVTFNAKYGAGDDDLPDELRKEFIGTLMQAFRHPSERKYKLWTYENPGGDLGYVWRVAYGPDVDGERVHRSKCQITPKTAGEWMEYEKTMFVWKEKSSPEAPGVSIEVV